MADIFLITGGQRSGKSRYAQTLAEKYSGNPVYLATARVWDADFELRIKRHQADRGNQWITVEEPVGLSRHDFTGKTVVLDCITLWLTNLYSEHHYLADPALEQAKGEWQKLIRQNFRLIVVTNELGMGVHPENEVARKFADLQGWMNQYIASLAGEVVLMVSGIPLQIK